MAPSSQILSLSAPPRLCPLSARHHPSVPLEASPCQVSRNSLPSTCQLWSLPEGPLAPVTHEGPVSGLGLWLLGICPQKACLSGMRPCGGSAVSA